MPISETHARQALQTILQTFERLTPDERKQMSEASVIRQFLDRLLEEVLGWPIKGLLQDNSDYDHPGSLFKHHYKSGEIRNPHTAAAIGLVGESVHDLQWFAFHRALAGHRRVASRRFLFPEPCVVE